MQMPALQCPTYKRIPIHCSAARLCLWWLLEAKGVSDRDDNHRSSGIEEAFRKVLSSVDGSGEGTEK